MLFAAEKPVTKEDAFIQTCIGEQYGAAKVIYAAQMRSPKN